MPASPRSARRAAGGGWFGLVAWVVGLLAWLVGLVFFCWLVLVCLARFVRGQATWLDGYVISIMWS